jgi:molybdopterin molybdotransferase
MSPTSATATILNLVQPLTEVEYVDLRSATGRILAQAVTSALDFPHWDNSAMDGYAIRFADVDQGVTFPVNLTVVEDIPAGYQPQRFIGPGQAARILTGSVMPAGADTVVMQEATARQADQVTICQGPTTQGQFVRRQGAFYQAGQPLLPIGIRLASAEIAVLAAAQCIQIPVYRRPRVAILSTGSELVSPEQPLQPGQIVDSNQFALTAWVEQMGAEAIPLGIVRDDRDATRAAIAQAITLADVVLSSGGVSVGDYDYVDRILAELGATLHIRAVAIKPGKPLTVATFATATSLYFGLPGNPVSALVTAWRFVGPALRRLSGLAAGWEPNFVLAKTEQELRSEGKRESYLWGQLALGQGEYAFTLAAGPQNSGNLINFAGTNALAVVPIGQTVITAGDRVQVLPISP